jgi:mycothione reductase
MKEYDIVIIGSGVGLSVLQKVLEKKMTCAFIEKSKFGGTCLTKGCIPSKILVHPADLIREAEHARKIGLTYSLPILDWDALSKRMWSKIDKSKEIEESVDEIDGIDVFKGTAEFTGPYSMRVLLEDNNYSEEFKGRTFVIAAGGRSFIPPVEGLEDIGYLDAEAFFGSGFPGKPWDRLVIVGGGAIGSEFAHVFSAFGTKVTIVEMQPHLVSTEEEEISLLLENNFRSHGIDVLTNCKALQASRQGDSKTVTVQNIKTGKTETILCDEILIASGIRSNTDLLKIEKTNIQTDKKGWIITDAHMQTSQKDVWALGDINGKYQFRHKANYEAQICAHNLFGGNPTEQSADYTKVPWAIFTFPQIAHVGLTEAEVRSKGGRYLVGTKSFSSVAKGYAMGYDDGDPDDGFVKLIADENMRILGAHIAGPHAAILIQSLVYLMNTGFTCKIEYDAAHKPKQICNDGGTYVPMNQSMVIHPALSEVVAWVTNGMHWANE